LTKFIHLIFSLFYTEGYQERQDKGEEQKQLSKECTPLVNPEWFSRFRGAANPDMTEEYIETVSERYIELYEKNPWEKFVKADISNINERIEKMC
jgi:phosphoribosylaminoimidazole-succinocarboxamide synthase